MNKRIAFLGYAGAGKDESAKPLINLGYKRVAFGDIIKRQLDALILQHMGFSAFTENREQKAKIRRTLEMWGEDNYKNVMNEFFDFVNSFDGDVVNTRLMRLREAKAWTEIGGILVLIQRPGVVAVTDFERDCLREIMESGLPFEVVENDSSTLVLHDKILAIHNRLS